MFGLLRHLRRPPALPDASLWLGACARAPWLAHLDATRDLRLQQLTARFLHDKTISPVDGLALTDTDRTVLAALCCLPLLEFGAQGLAGWHELVVYPDAFRVNRTHMDAAGVLHEWDDELIGEAWEAGPLILSWADVQADLADPQAGCCVAVHEMAHKLDALDGVLDGTPPLPRAWQREWAHDFQHSFDRFSALVTGGEETDIDPYAAESPEEFFAVCSEYHFSAPGTLQAQMPAVAAHLARLYGPPVFPASGRLPR